MATSTRSIVVELRIEDRGALARLGALEIETKQYQKELRALNAEIVKNGQATQQQLEKVGLLNASIRRNQTVIRELKNDLSGATDAGLRFRDKMAEASRAGLGAFGLQAASITALTVGVIEAVKELAKLSAEIEKIDARNKAIAGGSLPALTKAAEDNANAIGLTRREYVSLAADQQLRLKNLGIEGALTEELAIRTVETAEALSDFSGGQLDTNAAAKLLNDALTGQTRGLKELGINVKASKDEIDAIAVSLMETQGLTKEQATAVATLQLAFEATEKTMSVFKDQTLEIDQAQDAANAQLKEAKEALATGLTPAFTAATKAGASFLDMLARAVGGTGEEANIEAFTKRVQQQFEAIGGIGKLAAEEGSAAIQNFRFLAEGATQATEDIDSLLSRGNLIREKLKDVIEARRALEFERDQSLNPERNRQAIEALRIEEAAGRASLAIVAEEIKARGELIPVIQKQGEALEPQAKTIAELRTELAKLKKDREDLQVTNTKGLADNAAQTQALEAQIKALDISTTATKSKTVAVKELTAAQKEQLAQEQALAALPSGKDVLTKPQQDLAQQDPTKTIEDNTKVFLDAQEALRIAQITGTETLNLELLALDEQFYEEKIIGQEEYNARKKVLLDNDAEEQRQNNALLLSSAAQFFGGLADLTEQGTAEYKALATVQALVNTYLGATLALTDKTIPNAFVRIAAAVAVIASGLASVRKIQGFAEGGKVKKNGRVTEAWGEPVNRANGDTVLATLKPNEAVLNEDQQSRARRIYGDDFFKRIGVPGFAVGGRVSSTRGTALVNFPSVPRPSAGEIANVEATAEARAFNFSPVVSVVEMNRVQDRVRVIQSLSTA